MSSSFFTQANAAREAQLRKLMASFEPVMQTAGLEVAAWLTNFDLLLSTQRCDDDPQSCAYLTISVNALSKRHETVGNKVLQKISRSVWAHVQVCAGVPDAHGSHSCAGPAHGGGSPRAAAAGHLSACPVGCPPEPLNSAPLLARHLPRQGKAALSLLAHVTRVRNICEWQNGNLLCCNCRDLVTQGLQDAFDRHSNAIAEMLPQTVTHIRSAAQVCFQVACTCMAVPVLVSLEIVDNNLVTVALVKHEALENSCWTSKDMSEVDWVQGLLSAMAAGVRAKLRQLQNFHPRLQTKARREKLHATISEAATVLQTALGIVQGNIPFFSPYDTAPGHGTCSLFHHRWSSFILPDLALSCT